MDQVYLNRKCPLNAYSYLFIMCVLERNSPTSFPRLECGRISSPVQMSIGEKDGSLKEVPGMQQASENLGDWVLIKWGCYSKGPTSLTNQLQKGRGMSTDKPACKDHSPPRAESQGVLGTGTTRLCLGLHVKPPPTSLRMALPWWGAQFSTWYSPN